MAERNWKATASKLSDYADACEHNDRVETERMHLKPGDPFPNLQFQSLPCEGLDPERARILADLCEAEAQRRGADEPVEGPLDELIPTDEPPPAWLRDNATSPDPAPIHHRDGVITPVDWKPEPGGTMNHD